MVHLVGFIYEMRQISSAVTPKRICRLCRYSSPPPLQKKYIVLHYSNSSNKIIQISVLIQL